MSVGDTPPPQGINFADKNPSVKIHVDLLKSGPWHLKFGPQLNSVSPLVRQRGKEEGMSERLIQLHYKLGVQLCLASSNKNHIYIRAWINNPSLQAGGQTKSKPQTSNCYATRRWRRVDLLDPTVSTVFSIITVVYCTKGFCMDCLWG